jgi:hypothetical protein
MYPNASMMLFIPLNKGTHYSTDYRSKILYNHEKFIGDEAAMCLGGLRNLNTEITMKTGHKLSTRQLLKSIPASTGMSLPQLFQLVEPNSSGDVTVITYRKSDQHAVFDCREQLENNL